MEKENPNARPHHEDGSNYENTMSAGEIIINAVIRAAAVEDAVSTGEGGWVFVWSANAAEQIEAALAEAGYELCPNDKSSANRRNGSSSATNGNE